MNFIGIAEIGLALGGFCTGVFLFRKGFAIAKRQLGFRTWYEGMFSNATSDFPISQLGQVSLTVIGSVPIRQDDLAKLELLRAGETTVVKRIDSHRGFSPISIIRNEREIVRYDIHDVGLYSLRVNSELKISLNVRVRLKQCLPLEQRIMGALGLAVGINLVLGSIVLFVISLSRAT